MKIDRLETRHCDAGWRNYHFAKVTTGDGVVGWSEYDEDFGSPGITATIERLEPTVIGKDLGNHERIFSELFCQLRPAVDGATGQAFAAIENALLDAKAKTLGVPCYALFGGKVRDRIRLYWSHCATWRINHPEFYPPAIRDLDGVRGIGAEAKQRGFTALKTNIFEFGDGTVRGVAARLWHALRAGPQHGALHAAATARPPGCLAGRRRARYGHPARPELQLRHRGLP